MKEWSAKDNPPNEIWLDIKKTFTDVACENIGKKRKKPSKPYVSEEVMELARLKSKARKESQKDVYKSLKKEIQQKLRRDKKSWLEQECAKNK